MGLIFAALFVELFERCWRERIAGGWQGIVSSKEGEVVKVGWGFWMIRSVLRRSLGGRRKGLEVVKVLFLVDWSSWES